jgi:glycerol-3-phosphate acyltransferase PlsX
MPGWKLLSLKTEHRKDVSSIRVAVDVVSGDFGPSVTIKGVLEAREHSRNPFVAYCCGNEEEIVSELKKYGLQPPFDPNDIVIVDCPEQVESEDIPSRVWKQKKKSSIVRAIRLQKEGAVDATVSAGDTGILMTASIFILGKRPGVSRPALAAFLPTINDRFVLLIDVGANLGCRVEHLVDFARLGQEYMSGLFNIKSPRVALLNIGKEPHKGTSTIYEAGRKLEQQSEYFCGYVEGSQVLQGEADVIVCDGFSGNIVLKTCESFHRLVEKILHHDTTLLDALKQNMAIFNVDNYGGVPLLGIEGIVYKAHGSSSARAFSNAVLMAQRAGEASIHRAAERIGSQR